MSEVLLTEGGGELLTHPNGLFYMVVRRIYIIYVRRYVYTFLVCIYFPCVDDGHLVT